MKSFTLVRAQGGKAEVKLLTSALLKAGEPTLPRTGGKLVAQLTAVETATFL